MLLHLKAWPGASIAAYNPRSRGGNVLENAYLYSAGYTSDLRAVIGRIRERVGERAILAIAYSLGASVLGRLLGEDADGCELSAAVLCAPPLDPLLMSNHLETTVQGKLCDRSRRSAPQYHVWFFMVAHGVTERQWTAHALHFIAILVDNIFGNT